GDRFRHEEGHERHRPEREGCPAVYRDRRHVVDVDDGHHLEEHEVATSERTGDQRHYRWFCRFGGWLLAGVTGSSCSVTTPAIVFFVTFSAGLRRRLARRTPPTLRDRH